MRDADGLGTPYILEFSAGNAGPGAQTIGSPAVAKNVIATGASQNNRFDYFVYDAGQEAIKLLHYAVKKFLLHYQRLSYFQTVEQYAYQESLLLIDVLHKLSVPVCAHLFGHDVQVCLLIKN